MIDLIAYDIILSAFPADAEPPFARPCIIHTWEEISLLDSE